MVSTSYGCRNISVLPSCGGAHLLNTKDLYVIKTFIQLLIVCVISFIKCNKKFWSTLMLHLIFYYMGIWGSTLRESLLRLKCFIWFIVFIVSGWASSGCGERCRSSDPDGEEAGEREGNRQSDPQVRRCRTGGDIWWWWWSRGVLVCLSCWDLTTGLPCRSSLFRLFLYLTYRSSLSFSPSRWRFENT